ncbi:MAG TPA: 3-phosphoserine/phosphohydroxythreonine transaminase, partial [Polyangiaceae bacterium]|nr:3-phosphoserine/phosphohydroxythreonine transaminase [Polyangiaceae bacterium]
NETVEGLQFHRVIGRDDVPRICDMSSDFMSRPVQMERFALVYAHAQKNLGPSGVTLVLVRKALLERCNAGLPSMLDYRSHMTHGSIFNTPPVFAIYVTLLVTRWLLDEIGGLERMDVINREKAAALYRVIDRSDGFYSARAHADSRSLMNVVFRLASPEFESEFLRAAEHAGLYGLAGHRSIGGIRASLYNAVALESVHRLCQMMEDFQAAH